MHDTTEGQGTVKYVFCDPLTARVNDGVLQGGSNFWVSDETSLPVLLHGATCLSNFAKWNLGIFVEFCLWPHFALKGLTGEQPRLQDVSLRKLEGRYLLSHLLLPLSPLIFSLSPTSARTPLSERLEQTSQACERNPSRTPSRSSKLKHPPLTHMARTDLRTRVTNPSYLSSASGPKLTTLTLVDLPGVHFANDDPRMNQATQSLVLDYIEKNTKSIIVIVSEVGDPTGDSAINLVMRKAKDFRQRTICVLTKPDRLRETDDMGVKVALNKSSFTLEDGRFIVLRGKLEAVA